MPGTSMDTKPAAAFKDGRNPSCRGETGVDYTRGSGSFRVTMPRRTNDLILLQSCLSPPTSSHIQPHRATSRDTRTPDSLRERPKNFELF